MPPRPRTFAVVLLAPVLCAFAAAQAPQPSPTPSPTPAPSASPPARLRLDLERHAERVLDEKGLPRFETTVEVEAATPQSLLDRYFEGSPCGAAGGVPPATQAGRPATSPSVDFLGAAKALGKKLQSKGPDRYFIYRIREGERVRHSLREGPVPREWLAGVNGALYELIAAYRDRDDAAAALRRLERGDGPREPKASPCPPGR
ncbi:MAG TPA: hypothetical protein VFM88_11610 [Vicinamibacteria bacterium]|nr:hypothetical protein [Vicinamibacteria bacterium]